MVFSPIISIGYRNETNFQCDSNCLGDHTIDRELIAIILIDLFFFSDFAHLAHSADLLYNCVPVAVFCCYRQVIDP